MLSQPQSQNQSLLPLALSLNAVNCVALGIARLSFLVWKGGNCCLGPLSVLVVALFIPDFKKKCSIPILEKGTFSRASQSETADPMRPLPWAPGVLGQGRDVHTWDLETNLGLSLSPAI